MADASGISEDALAWTSQWYLRQDTLRGGQHPAGQRPPRESARGAVGRRNAVVLRRATVPAARPKPHRPRTVAVLPRRGHHHLHPCLRSALHVRHQGHPDDLAGSRRRARRDLRQPHRPAARRAHRRHRRPNPGDVRDLPPRRVAVLPTHPRHRPPAALPPRRRIDLARPLPARRTTARPTDPDPADRRALERHAPPGGLDEVRAHHRQPAHRQAARQQSTIPAWPGRCTNTAG